MSYDILMINFVVLGSIFGCIGVMIILCCFKFMDNNVIIDIVINIV